MTLNILFAARPARWPEFRDALIKVFGEKGLDVHLSCDIPPAEVDYIIYAPTGPISDFTPYTRAKAVMSLWAGVEKVTGNETLTIPLTRMVDDGLSQGMQDWVVGHVMRHHLDMDRHILNQSGHWDPFVPPLATERHVTILGLGALGQTCATALAQLGFLVTGWSRSPKDVPGLNCLSGKDGLTESLQSAEILVLLLPDTAETRNLIDAESLALLPKDAVIINPGRGPLIDDDALLAALDAGHLRHATLDVFRVEPLPVDHPYWAHPKVTVTPHIAADTRPSSAARVIAENIRLSESGAQMLYLVDRKAGY